jgi:pimeloyl-ACP methyl ester carboxylesterase
MTTLDVPGASLYYEQVGSGPLLLLIPGGNGDAASLLPLGEALAGRYTAVSYDRRGFARSPLSEPIADDERFAADVEDAYRLIRHLSDEPAIVMGSSSGAIVALHLLVTHPQACQLVVPHEPPLAGLLSDGADRLAELDAVYETYQTSGVEAAMRQFLIGIGLGQPEQQPDPAMFPPAMREMFLRATHNQPYWLEHELRTYPRSMPDLDALRAVSGRLALAGGEDSHPNWFYRTNTVIAERFGIAMTDLPGGHVGYLTHGPEFAAAFERLITPPGR